MQITGEMLIGHAAVLFLAACAVVSIISVAVARDRSGQPLDD